MSLSFYHSLSLPDNVLMWKKHKSLSVNSYGFGSYV